MSERIEAKTIELKLGPRGARDLKLVLHVLGEETRCVHIFERIGEKDWCALAEMDVEALYRIQAALDNEAHHWGRRCCPDHGYFDAGYAIAAECPKCLEEKALDEKAEAALPAPAALES